MVLILQNFGNTAACGFLNVSVSMFHEFNEDGNQLLVDFWHVKQVYHFVQVLDQFHMLPPAPIEFTNEVIADLFPSESRQIYDKDHEALQ